MDYEVNLTIESYYSGFKGITDKMHGYLSLYPDQRPILYDKKDLSTHPFFQKLWEDYIDELSSTPQPSTPPPGGEGGKDDPRVKDLKDKVGSPDFRDGYKDGWNEVIAQAVKDGLIPPTTELTEGSFKFKFASTNASYDEGYDYGKKKAQEALDAILNPQKGGSSAPRGGNPTPDLRSIPQIGGLMVITVPEDNEGQNNGNTDPNVPIKRKQKEHPGAPGQPGDEPGGGGGTPGAPGQPGDEPGGGGGGIDTRGRCSAENTGTVITREQGERILRDSGYWGQTTRTPQKSKAEDIFTPSMIEENVKDATRGLDAEENRKIIDTIRRIEKQALGIMSARETVIPWQETLADLLVNIAEDVEIGWDKKTIIGSHRTYEIDHEDEIDTDGNEVAIFVDTSGSVGNDVLVAITNEIMGICLENALSKVRVFTFDDAVSPGVLYDLDDDPEPKIKMEVSSGGTRIYKVFPVVEKEYGDRMDELNAVIIFTDNQLIHDLRNNRLPELNRIDWGDKLIFIASLSTNDMKFPGLRTSKCTIIPTNKDDLAKSVGL